MRVSSVGGREEAVGPARRAARLARRWNTACIRWNYRAGPGFWWGHLLERALRGHFRRQLRREWSGEVPEWFDHRIDLYTWRDRRPHSWIERGVYAREVIPPEATVLDLCCGDGFYDYYYLSPGAARVDALDRDPAALRQARRLHASENIRYVRADIRRDRFPSPRYDAVIWNASIEHFTADEIASLCERIANTLGEHGVLAGYTILASEQPSHPDHRCEFGSGSELAGLLRRWFPCVLTRESTEPGRTNLYFRAARSAADLSRFAFRPPLEHVR